MERRRSDVHSDRVIAAARLAPLVVRDAAAHVPASVDRQDLCAAALEGLVAAARRFDPTRGVPFEAYARRRMRGAVLDELRAADPLSRSQRAASRAAAVPVPGAPTALRMHRGTGAGVQALEAVDPDDTPIELVLGAEELGDVRAALATLPARRRDVVRAHFIDGREMQDIASELGVSVSRVSQICSESVRQLRRILGVVESAPPVSRPERRVG